MVILLLIEIGILFLVMVLVHRKRFARVPPETAMVVFGHPRHLRRGPDIITTGAKFIIPINEEAVFLPLRTLTLELSLENTMTEGGRGPRIDVTAEAKVKISDDPYVMRTAAEMLLRKSDEEISTIARGTLTGHLRGICARLTVDELRNDKARLAGEAQKTATQDLANMGFDLLAFDISRITIRNET